MQGRCGEEHHSSDCSSETPLCINCKQGHPADSRFCPEYTTQQSIRKVMQDNNIGIQDPRAILTGKSSFASVLKRNMEVRPPVPDRRVSLTATLPMRRKLDHQDQVVDTKKKSTQYNSKYSDT